MTCDGGHCHGERTLQQPQIPPLSSPVEIRVAVCVARPVTHFQALFQHQDDPQDTGP